MIQWWWLIFAYIGGAASLVLGFFIYAAIEMKKPDKIFDPPLGYPPKK